MDLATRLGDIFGGTNLAFKLSIIILGWSSEAIARPGSVQCTVGTLHSYLFSSMCMTAWFLLNVVTKREAYEGKGKNGGKREHFMHPNHNKPLRVGMPQVSPIVKPKLLLGNMIVPFLI